MKQKRFLKDFCVLVLGAIDGLLVGLIVEEGRITYLEHEIRESLKMRALNNDYAADYFYPSREVFVPLLCVVIFACLSYLVYRYFINHPQLLSRIWLMLGAFALWAAYFIEASNPNISSWVSVVIFIAVSYFIYRFWANHLEYLPVLWLVIGVSAVIAVAAGAQLLAPFITSRYEHRRPLTWLLCLAIVVLVNSIYGVVLQMILPQRYQINLKHKGSSGLPQKPTP